MPASWIPAESEAGIIHNLRDLALRLCHPESQDLPAKARWARDRVAQSTLPWLLVFDNLRDGSDLVPEIAEVERSIQARVAEDPETRHFGPPPFAEHHANSEPVNRNKTGLSRVST